MQLHFLPREVKNENDQVVQINEEKDGKASHKLQPSHEGSESEEEKDMSLRSSTFLIFPQSPCSALCIIGSERPPYQSLRPQLIAPVTLHAPAVKYNAHLRKQH